MNNQNVNNQENESRQNEVKEYFERMWGEVGVDKRWSGYRFMTVQENIDNGNMIELNEEDLN